MTDTTIALAEEVSRVRQNVEFQIDADDFQALEAVERKLARTDATLRDLYAALSACSAKGLPMSIEDVRGYRDDVWALLNPTQA